MAVATMTTSEARKDFANVVLRVKNGVKVILNRHDRPVAVMISIEEYRRFRVLEDHNDFLAARKGAEEPGEVSWDDLKAQLGL